MVALVSVAARAQQSITIVGGDIADPSGSISFSAGEVAVQRSQARAITVVNITSYFTEGVQQGYSTGNNGIAEPLSIKLTVSPNPTPGLVEIAVADGNYQGLSLSLYNIKGETVYSSKLTGERTQIDLSDKPAGTYILHVANPTRNEKNLYKIIKAN